MYLLNQDWVTVSDGSWFVWPLLAPLYCVQVSLPAAASAGGRYLQDTWVYNLNKLQWTAPQPPQAEAAEPSGTEEEGSALLAAASPPASAGWSVTPLQDKLLVMGGHVKVGKVGDYHRLSPFL